METGETNLNPPVGWIYRNVWLYRLAMLALYRSRYRQRYQMMANEIPPGSSVVDLCCGDAPIAALLKEKGCSYIGLDINPRFVNWGRRHGIDIRLWDAEHMEIPEADFVCAQSCLYHFIPNDRKLVAAMLSKARSKVLISEPVANMTTGSSSLLSRLAKNLTQVNGKVFHSRHSEQTLRALFDDLPAQSVRYKPIVGRDLLVIVSGMPSQTQGSKH